jgi:hypothetical protein
MAELNLPLLAHTGGEISMPVNRPDLESVDTLVLPLKCSVNVIAAHYGTCSLRDQGPSLGMTAGS